MLTAVMQPRLEDFLSEDRGTHSGDFQQCFDMAREKIKKNESGKKNR